MNALCDLSFNNFDAGFDLLEEIVNCAFQLLADLLGSDGLHAFQ
jgi:hypothetical protein